MLRILRPAWRRGGSHDKHEPSCHGFADHHSSNSCTCIHLGHKSVNQNAVLEFRMILNSHDVNRTWALCLCEFGIGILTENFMNSEPSGILYCLIWVHELIEEHAEMRAADRLNGGHVSSTSLSIYPTYLPLPLLSNVGQAPRPPRFRSA